MLRPTPLVILVTLLSAGCATRTVSFQGSPLQPAADVKAEVRLDQNENTLVELNLQYVAPAEMLWPPRAVYVVWAESSEGRFYLLGQLRVNERREAQLKATTALDRLRLVITAENDPWPDQPSEPYMLATDFFSARRGWLP
jgi:hypothetical protein